MTLDEKLLVRKRLESDGILEIAIGHWSRAQELAVKNADLQKCANHHALVASEERERAKKYLGDAIFMTIVAIALVIVAVVIVAVVKGACHG